MRIRSRHPRITAALLVGSLTCACGGGSSAPTRETNAGHAPPGRESAVVQPSSAARSTGTQAIGRATSAQRWDFERTVGAALPAGFTPGAGRWQTTAWGDAPSGGRVLVQRAASRGSVFNVVLGEPAPADLDVTVRLQAVTGDTDQGGGLIWRAQSPENYYVARYNPLEDNFRLYTVVGGQRSMLESATVHVDHAAWHTMRVVMSGSNIVCYLDGESHLEASDETFPLAGRVGLWTKADAVTRFDDLTVSAL